MFVYGIASLTTPSRKLQLETVKQLPTQTAWQLNSSITKTVWLYARTGFLIKVVMMDQEFNKIEDSTKMVEINTTAGCKHVGKIEQFIRIIKEWSRAHISDLPYNLLLRQVIIHLVYFTVLWLNSLPASAGVSEIYSPQKNRSWTQTQLHETLHCPIWFLH
jgi:hypothetical protein